MLSLGPFFITSATFAAGFPIIRLSMCPQTNPSPQDPYVFPSPPSLPSAISSISSFFPDEGCHYDALLLDQFGVLHDGKTAYPAALSAVEKLAQRGVKMVILSNSSRRADETLSKLPRFGFEKNWFAGAVTSGELAYQTIRASERYRGRKVVHVNWVGRGAVGQLREMGVECVGRDLSQIEFMLVHGTEGVSVAGGDGTEVESVKWEQLVSMVRKVGSLGGIELVCANPDIVTVDGDTLRMMPGTLAKEFEKAGGKQVVRLGKPEGLAYDAAMEILKRHGVRGRTRVLAVGDSLLHDILGAANAGIDSLFVAGGIAAEEFGLNGGQECDFDVRERPFEWLYSTQVLASLAEREAPGLMGRMPNYVTPYFQW